MRSILLRLPLLFVLLTPLPASAVVAIDWATVGDPGNACDVQSQGCFGSVAESYRIGKFEVTNDQYAEFLNAVAVTDTNGLYSIFMGAVPGLGGIAHSGFSGHGTRSFTACLVAAFSRFALIPPVVVEQMRALGYVE